MSPLGAPAIPVASFFKLGTAANTVKVAKLAQIEKELSAAAKMTETLAKSEESTVGYINYIQSQKAIQESTKLAAGNVVKSFRGVTADEIVALNRQFATGVTQTGDVGTVLANMSYRESFWDKAATAIRDITGRHLFQDGNHRTAQAVVESLMGRNAVIGPSAAHIRSVIEQVGLGNLRSVEEISAALTKF